MNVSLPPEQDHFVRSQVEAGRYRTASEVVRDGLRLLEEAEHQRLLEKWLYQGLTEAEEHQLPPELLERARRHVRSLVEEGMRSGAEEGWIERSEVIERQKRRIRERFGGGR
ncbi:MAG: type II toxin-antitoxin system ParD family antitoxin [Acidobacteriota bacterium]